MYKKHEEELLFQRWIQGAQYQVNFKEFKKLIEESAEPKKEKSETEILDKVKDILDMVRR